LQRLVQSDPEQHIFNEVLRDDCYGVAALDWEPQYILDIGAHIGLFSLLASMLWPTARILAIEPHPPTFARLRENTLTVPNIQCHQAAHGDGLVTMWPGEHAGVMHYAGEPQSAAERLAGLRSPVTAISTGVRSLALSAMFGLADAKPQTTVVKMDTEGSEYCLLGDTEGTALLRRTRYITMEIHPHNVTYPALTSELRRWLWNFARTHVVTLHIPRPHGGMVRMSLAR